MFLLSIYCDMWLLLVCSLVFMRMIQIVTLLRSDKKITLNLYSSICFIRPKILCILGILGLSFCVGLKPFIFDIYLNTMLSFNIFNDLIYIFKNKDINILNK